jgi:NAD-dependent histone deacetylase SIR2
MENSPAPDHISSKRSLEEDADGKPAKRRKLRQPKPRTTHHLNLQSDELDAGQKEQLDRLLKVLYKRRKIVVVAGAGISVSAGSKSSSIRFSLRMY